LSGFDRRVEGLPHLGLGVSTEYGAGRADGVLDVAALRRDYPAFASFLEVGVEVAKGLDGDAAAWAEAGLPTTYHFLDINLDEPEDLDDDWLHSVRSIAARLRPAWMCGDAGLWHFGRRERGQMLLLPPVLSRDAARSQADGVRALREATGFEVLPENPPGAFYLGDLHLLDFYAAVLDDADTGMLLDAAHLAIYQRLLGHRPLDGLDGFPLDLVVELHVAGGSERDQAGFAWVDDTHTGSVLPDTWAILEFVLPRARNLRAIIFECERNPLHVTLPGFRRIADTAGPGFLRR
jgi:uncharacterized protein (UPF0276 family)